MDSSSALSSPTSGMLDQPRFSLEMFHSRLMLRSMEFQNRRGHDSSSSYTCAPSLHEPLTTVEDFVTMLQRSSLPGPMILTSDRGQIGCGAQFMVFKQQMAYPRRKGGFITLLVAVKQPKYFLAMDQRLNLADSSAKRQVHDLHLEILALCHPILRSHRNIVRFLAWAGGMSTWHSPLVLIFELALGNLSVFLAETETDHDDPNSIDTLWNLKYRLCLDIAAGLDALHECQIVHGDLKPQNILIFQDGAVFVAKLADFGLSIEEQETGTPCTVGGTRGWQAPEVEERCVSWEYVAQTDNYSYGVLVWSVMYCSGECPPTPRRKKEILENAETRYNTQFVPDFLHSLLLQALPELLCDEAQDRPMHLVSAMKSESHTFEDWALIYECNADNGAIGSDSDSCESFDDSYEWQVQPLPDHLVLALSQKFDEDPESVRGDQCFAIALRECPFRDPDSTVLHHLCAAALFEYEPAQALVSRAYSYMSLRPPPEVQSRLPHWLYNATSAGSLVAFQELATQDPAAATNAMSTFRALGGYNRFYCGIGSAFENITPGNIVLTNEWIYERYGYNWLHWTAAYGDLPIVEQSLQMVERKNINIKSDNDETPLYLACVRGAWDIAEFLMNHGADPSITCTSRNLTCLHWLFAFEPELHETIAQSLISNGASVNAMAGERLPFYHYPFFLPSGCPLHWAVTVSCAAAIKALIINGADPGIRNGCDPYRYDDRVRVLIEFGWPDLSPFSLAEHATMGLSSLDIAARNRDPFIFETLEALTPIKFDINSSDEEGFTVLHRMSKPFSSRLYLDNQDNYFIFKGDASEQNRQLHRTVKCINDLGGDLNMFTKQIVEESDPWQAAGMSPLMLATLDADLELVKALVANHADISLQNERGETALHCIQSTSSSELQYEANLLASCRFLVEQGADIHCTASDGMSPVLYAAFAGYIDIVDFFLSQGAVVTQMISDPRHSQSIWIALRDRWPSGMEDRKIASLIERHLLPEPNVEKRNTIIEQADSRGASLFHHFASFGMPHSMDAILKSGCNVNTLMKKWNIRPGSNDQDVKNTWYVTPLDEALERRNRAQQNTELSSAEKAQLWQNADHVVLSLKEAGAVRASRPVRSQEINFRQEDFDNKEAYCDAIEQL